MFFLVFTIALIYLNHESVQHHRKLYSLDVTAPNILNARGFYAIYMITFELKPLSLTVTHIKPPLFFLAERVRFSTALPLKQTSAV